MYDLIKNQQLYAKILSWSTTIAGMINGGFGETHINSILAALNILSITKKALKKRGREVGHQLNSMAEESCKKQLNKELEMYALKM